MVAKHRKGGKSISHNRAAAATVSGDGNGGGGPASLVSGIGVVGALVAISRCGGILLLFLID